MENRDPASGPAGSAPGLHWPAARRFRIVRGSFGGERVAPNRRKFHFRDRAPAIHAAALSRDCCFDRNAIKSDHPRMPWRSELWSESTIPESAIQFFQGYGTSYVILATLNNAERAG